MSPPNAKHDWLCLSLRPPNKVRVTFHVCACGIFVDMKRLVLLFALGCASCAEQDAPDLTWKHKPSRIVSEALVDTSWQVGNVVDVTYDAQGRLDSAFTQYPQAFVLFADFVKTDEQLGTFEAPWDRLVRAATAAQGQLMEDGFHAQEMIRHFIRNGRLDSVHALDGTGTVRQVV